MAPDRRLADLEERYESLLVEKEFALRALESAAALGNIEASLTRQEGPESILRQTADRLFEMLPLRVAAFYLIDEQDQDFNLVYSEGEAPGLDLRAEIEALIKDQSFAFALTRNKPTFFNAEGASGRLLLHPLTTSSRTRGMFVGLLEAMRGDVSDITLALCGVVMNACAQALESQEFYHRLDVIKRDLEKTVEERSLELRRSYEHVRVILESIQAGVVAIEPGTHRILEINPAGARMVGLPREEIVGQTCFDCFCPASRGCCPVLDQGREIASQERTLRTFDGREIPILKTAVRTTLEGRECVVESFVDVTEQKKLLQLREDVERITRHDLKTPLTGVISLPDLLLDDASLTEEHREILGLIRESGLKMLGMINLSLDIYKMETGTYRLRPVPVNVAATLADVLRDLDRELALKSLQTEIRVDGRLAEGRPFHLMGEPLLFFSLFSNLLKNAVEASPVCETVSIDLASGEPAETRIHNMGAVPAEVQGRFFQKYATSGKAQGTGLGAYSARLIVTSLGGTIDFTSSETAGTTIVMRLPAALPEAEDL